MPGLRKNPPSRHPAQRGRRGRNCAWEFLFTGLPLIFWRVKEETAELLPSIEREAAPTVSKSQSSACVLSPVPVVYIFSDLSTPLTKESKPMGHSPQLNPTTNTELNGKLHRYATHTSCVRAFRIDPDGERALKRIKLILSRHCSTSPHGLPDCPSFSLIVRRSLKHYCDFLDTVAPGGVEDERRRVREHSNLPVKN